MCRLQKFLQPGSIEQQLRLVEVIERIAKVHQHQVALVPQQRVGGELSGLFTGRKRFRYFVRDLRLARRVELAPRYPAETKHLVQHAVAFQRERHCRQFSRNRLYIGLRSHSETPRCEKLKMTLV